MGWESKYIGGISVAPALNVHEVAFLARISGRRHDGNSDAPPNRHGSRCCWISTADGNEIVWNGEEKFYDADIWMAYLIDSYFKHAATAQQQPGFDRFTFDHELNGEVEVEGPEDDCWRIIVRNNEVYAHFAQEEIWEDSRLGPVLTERWRDVIYRICDSRRVRVGGTLIT